MDNKECMEKQFYDLMTDLNAIMKSIETYSNRFRIEGVAQNDIIYRNLLQKLVDLLSLLRRNDYFWFIFSAHKCIHASFLDAIGVLIRSKRTFGFQKQAIGILMSTLNRSEHANHLSQFSIGSSSLATRCCWCVGIYNMFFHSVITPTELLFFLDFDNTEIDEPELVPVLLDYAMLFVKMLHVDGSAWLITLDRFVDFFERFRLSSPLAANQLGSIKLAKMITLTIDILKGRISYINHDLVSRILKRVKRSIVELFEERSNNGSNFNTNHDLHEMMKGLFHLISIYASHLQFERNPYSAIYFDMIDFYVELVRGLIRNRFTEVSALLLDDLYVTLCMMFNNRMIRTEMLTARQLSIADLGVDILRNSQSFLSKHLMGSILDLGFRCINDSEVALDYIWNNGWHDIEPIWKRHFLASKPDGLNLASDLVCNFSFEIKRLEYLPLLKLFIDTSLEYLLAELKKEELTKAPHFFTQRALISIIDASSRLKQPVTFVKPLIDAYASLFKRFDITHWLVSFNNPLYFYVGLLEVRPVRKPCYLDKSEIWSPSFEFILDQFHKYNIEHIDVKSTSSHQLALFAIIEGLIWYYRKSFPANRKSQLLDFLNYIKKDSSEVHQADIQRLIHSLNRIQCSEN